jgi:hypothetical protein
MELTERLREAIDDAERIAQAALAAVGEGTAWQSMTDRIWKTYGYDVDPVLAHVDAQNPAAVLRRCAADRMILDEYDAAFAWYEGNKTSTQTRARFIPWGSCSPRSPRRTASR